MKSSKVSFWQCTYHFPKILLKYLTQTLYLKHFSVLHSYNFIIPFQKSSVSQSSRFAKQLSLIEPLKALQVSFFFKYFFYLCWMKELSLRKECPYSKLFWSVFSSIRTDHGEILRIFPYSVRMRGNMDHNNSEYGLFLRSV